MFSKRLKIVLDSSLRPESISNTFKESSPAVADKHIISVGRGVNPEAVKAGTFLLIARPEFGPCLVISPNN